MKTIMKFRVGYQIHTVDEKQEKTIILHPADVLVVEAETASEAERYAVNLLRDQHKHVTFGNVVEPVIE